MKALFIPALAASLLLTLSCGNSGNTSDRHAIGEASQTVADPSNVKPVQLTKALFITNVFDYEKNPENWMYKGMRPCIIDFYADWCRPCKQIAPLMEAFAETYQGKVDIYKVNIDQERELAELFGIRSIPTVMFCPMEGKPQMTQGVQSKQNYEQIITALLLKETKKTSSN